MTDSEYNATGNDNSQEPKAAKLFTVPEGVKHLDPNQLAMLEESFISWADEAKDERSRRARLRVWLVFLLLRYSGARLGEVLDLDDTRDFHWERMLVRFHATGEEREVALPAFVMEELKRIIEDPAMRNLRGEIFRLDQGYMRRKFYEQAERIDLPRDMLTPRVLRHSRAVELLREGVPLPAMQAILGHSSMHGASSYYKLSTNDLQRIIQHYVQKETRMKTSARNTFVGQVASVSTGAILSEVEIATARGIRIISIITNESAARLDIRIGRTVTAVVKAPWVILVKAGDQVKTSARNSFPGRVVRLNQGNVAAEVVGVLEDNSTLCALITTESVRNLELAIGQTVWFQFEAFSVILNVE